MSTFWDATGIRAPQTRPASHRGRRRGGAALLGRGSALDFLCRHVTEVLAGLRRRPSRGRANVVGE